jgi:hypothetical protein
MPRRQNTPAPHLVAGRVALVAAHVVADIRTRLCVGPIAVVDVVAAALVALLVALLPADLRPGGAGLRGRPQPPRETAGDWRAKPAAEPSV